MRVPWVQLYVHVVWATWDRRPLITRETEPRLFGAIEDKCKELRCDAYAIGGTADHVHLLARLHPTVSIARLVGEVKGASSHAVTHEIAPGRWFRWQGAYGAFTVGVDDLTAVKSYVQAQKRHHARELLLPELEP